MCSQKPEINVPVPYSPHSAMTTKNKKNYRMIIFLMPILGFASPDISSNIWFVKLKKKTTPTIKPKGIWKSWMITNWQAITVPRNHDKPKLGLENFLIFFLTVFSQSLIKPNAEIHNQVPGQALGILSKRGQREYVSKGGRDHEEEVYRDNWAKFIGTREF